MATVIIRPNGEEIPIDATLSIGTSDRNKVTSKPVEDRTNVSDNVTPMNKIIRIQGIISDATLAGVGDVSIVDNRLSLPIPSFLENYINLGVIDQFFPDIGRPSINQSTGLVSGSGAFTVQTQPVVNRYINAKNSLQEARANRELITLQETQEIYSDLVITSLNFNRDADISEAISFSMTLEGIRVVGATLSRSVRQPATSLNGVAAEPTENGEQNPDDVDINNSSAILRIIEQFQTFQQRVNNGN